MLNLKPMRHYFVTFYYLGLIGLVLFLLPSCANDVETSSFTNEDSEIINYAEKFADFHNECLDFCYQTFKIQTKTEMYFSSNEEFNERIVELVNLYVDQQRGVSSKAHSIPLTLEFITSLTITDIRDQMSEAELIYIDRILQLDPAMSLRLEEMKKEILGDISLSTVHKKAILAFLSLYEKSFAYWNVNYQKWIDLKSMYINLVTTKAAGWVVADCYWGWYGTVSSGGNGLVGAGAAAVASMCAAM